MENSKFEVKNLNLHYGAFHALKNINMDIAKNEITAFIGPSGCGKSTFLKTLNRMNDLVDGVKIISSALKMVTDMERIGDQAADICEVAMEMSELTYIVPSF